MKVVVQKFGGTSLASPEARSRVCSIIAEARKQGFKPVVVVSAIGRENDPYATDTLINLLKQVNPCPSPRELDLLLSCGELISGVLLSSQLAAGDIPACYLSGERAGIVTDGNYSNAHILYIRPGRLLDLLAQDCVPVVAGFQGVSEEGELTTLGRGGSDTTAAALGVALRAEVVDIFTDVEGVMTADPRIVENARLLDAITYNEICQLAREGAKVIHPRAVEIAMQAGIPLRVRSTFADSEGTLVANQLRGGGDNIQIIRDNLITGITYTSTLAQLKISKDAPGYNGFDLAVFQAMARADISVDFINVQPDRITFTVLAEAGDQAVKILNDIDIFPALEFNCAKVAVVGAAMTGIPGVMARVVEALSEKHIPILQSGDSYTNIWCLVKREHMERAVKALHDKFELGKKIRMVGESMQLPRLWTAMITPFDEQLKVNYSKAVELANYLCDNGSEGIIVSGTTGESPVLSMEEQLQLFALIKEKVGKRVPIWGTGSNNTAHVVELSREAEKAGLDGLLLVCPYYNKPPQEALYRHFKTIAEAVSIPVMLYNIPGRTAVNMTPATMARLAEIDNVVAVKESTGDMEQCSLLNSLLPADVAVFSGDDSLTLPMMALGARGVVSIVSHILGNEIKAMIDAFVAGNVEQARELHIKLFPAFKGLFITTNPIPLKAALNLMGMEVGGVRLPLIEADDAQVEAMRALLKSYNLMA